MKLPRNPLTPQATLYLVVALAVFVTVFGAWWIVIGGPAHDRQRAAEATAGRVIAEGQAAATRDAQNVVIDQSQSELKSGGLDATNEAAIRAGGPDAGLRALCLRDAYRDQPACVELRKPHP